MAPEPVQGSQDKHLRPNLPKSSEPRPLLILLLRGVSEKPVSLTAKTLRHPTTHSATPNAVKCVIVPQDLIEPPSLAL